MNKNNQQPVSDWEDRLRDILKSVERMNQQAVKKELQELLQEVEELDVYSKVFDETKLVNRDELRALIKKRL